MKTPGKIIWWLFVLPVLPLACGTASDGGDGDDDAAGDDDTEFVGEESTPLGDFDDVPYSSDGPRILFPFAGGVYGPETFIPEFDSDVCDPPQQQKSSATGPKIGPPILELNGTVVEALPDTLQIPSVLRVLYPFADADCDLSCGWYAAGYDFADPEWGPSSSAGSAASNIPCSTMESNVYFGFYFPIEWTGSYRATFTVADVAGNKSLRVTSMFDAP